MALGLFVAWKRTQKTPEAKLALGKKPSRPPLDRRAIDGALARH